MTIKELKPLRESEDKVEFKSAMHNFSYAGSEHKEQEERRKCFLGYVVAFANEGGGMLVLGMADKAPHNVVGTDFAMGKMGALEDETYSRLGIRVSMEELYENGLRVLVVHIPTRSKGKLLKFEGVPLMRIGESLRNMSDEEMFSILSEQDPDFSAKICEGIGITDLDEVAVQKLKTSYSKKQDNPLFLTLSDSQALSDLGLIKGNQVTFAALILLGKEVAIKQYLPQSAIFLEYRNTMWQIHFDNRKMFTQPYFIAIDNLWEAINQRNGNTPVQQGAFIFDIPFFNKEVIREAINNAVAHRDYRLTSEIVIKQFPNEMHILNPGGFPFGVSLQNLLTVNSTPRNRLLADVLAKTGMVERAGQGVDKIFYQTISEGKPLPDYSRSDNFQVELHLSGIVEDKAFALFIQQIQEKRKDDEKLNLSEIIVLNQIRKGSSPHIEDAEVINTLVSEGLIEQIGKGNGQKYNLSKEYYAFDGKARVSGAEKSFENIEVGNLADDLKEIFMYFQFGKKVTAKDIETEFELNNRTAQRKLNELIEKDVIEKVGTTGPGVYYKLKSGNG